MGKRIPFNNGDEHDILGFRNPWRKWGLSWRRAGATDSVKRAYRRRERRVGEAVLRLEALDLMGEHTD